jgi:type VI protein secretion system component Hcp
MNDVVITSVAIDAATGAVPSESVAFNFSKVHVEYKVFKADGSAGPSVQFKYDVKTQKEG